MKSKLENKRNFIRTSANLIDTFTDVQYIMRALTDRKPFFTALSSSGGCKNWSWGRVWKPKIQFLSVKIKRTLFSRLHFFSCSNSLLRVCFQSCHK